MDPAEVEIDAQYGRLVLAALRARGLSTSRWNYAAITAIERASRAEFLALFKKHDLLASYELLELVRTASPEALADRLASEANDQLTALIPWMFMGAII